MKNEQFAEILGQSDFAYFLGQIVGNLAGKSDVVGDISEARYDLRSSHGLDEIVDVAAELAERCCRATTEYKNNENNSDKGLAHAQTP
ncbi:hypothetical protein LCGC14_0686100 [marine sediment metagenome]|uniref:Uncharacterized protein n=1 Tax=marine sediment metagenome TaxID=412755 RepID=A0A0F9R768_9ZZZZ